MAQLPVSGWFDDPKNTDLERWWNGTRWTDLTREKPLPPPTLSAAPQASLKGSNPWAVIGLIMGAVGLLYNPFLIPSVIGLVFSSLGIARATSLGEATGERVNFPMAVIGLVLSIIAAFLVLLNVSWALSRLVG